MMTVAYIEAEIERIKTELAGDDEVQHSSENQLHQEVLTAIADGECEDPEACARAALMTCELGFSRWCA